MLDCIQVANSTRLTAIAFDEPEQRIYIRFNDGSIYEYDTCTRNDWNEFTAPGTSKGAFVSKVLNHHVYHRIE